MLPALTTTQLIFLALLFLLLYWYIQRRDGRNYWEKRNVPHLKPTFIFGNFRDTFLLKTAMGDLLRNHYEKFNGKYFGMWILTTPLFVVRDPKLIKTILIKDFKCFQNRLIASDEKVDSLAANIMAISKSPVWNKIRAAMTPMFSSAKIKSVHNFLDSPAKAFVKHIESNWLDKVMAAPNDITYLYTADVIINCMFGLECNSFENPNNEFLQCIRKITNMSISGALSFLCSLMCPSLVSIFKIKMFDSSIYDFMRSVVWDTINYRKKHNIKRNDLIDILTSLMERQDLEDFKFEGDAVVAQALTFYGAGQLTVASSISYAFYELALNPEVQKKLRKEIKDVIKTDAELTFENVSKINYLNSVIYETLRKYPSVPLLDRVCSENYKIPDSDLILEKGTPVYISVLGMHFDPNYFPNPETFDPERFSAENLPKIPDFTYLPFGEGPRNCIGKRFGMLLMQVILIHASLNFEIRQTPTTNKKIDFDPKNIFLDPITDFNIMFTRLQ